MLSCDNGTIDSSVTDLFMAEEECLKKLPGTDGVNAVWHGMEPNSYADFGGETTTVARAPISKSRQRKKGTVVDVTAAGGFNQDFTKTNTTWALQGFFMADARQSGTTAPLNAARIPLTGVSATDKQYLAASGLTVIPAGALIFASGFVNASNNGVKNVTATATGAVTVSQSLIAEATPPAVSRVDVVGAQFAASDVSLAVTSGMVSLIATAADFTVSLPGLLPGMWLFLGDDAPANSFANNVGYARVASVSAKAILFDDVTWTAVNESGAGKTIRIYSGITIRNEKERALIKERSYNIERQLGEGENGPQAEYLEGAVANELTLNLPSKEKITVDLGYTACLNTFRSGDDGDELKTGTRIPAPGEEAFNTATDLYRVSMTIVDPVTGAPMGLFGMVTEATITIGNNVTVNDALGIVGAAGLSLGDFDAGGTVTAYFTKVSSIRAVRNNADVSFNVIAASKNSGFVFDTPLVGLSGAGLNVEKDTPITIPLTAAGAENKNGYTMSYTSFLYLPTVAMPE